jgi:hypothetical protein
MNFRQKVPLFFGLFGFLCLLLPNAAKADSFDWTYQGTMLGIPSGILDSGSGELTTTGGVITGLSGTFNGLDITALLPPGAFVGNDNVLLIPPAPLYLTPGGFSFLDSAGTQFNIYAVLGTQCTCGPSGCVCVPYDVYGSISDNGINNDIGNFTLTPFIATPEPAAMAMLLPAVVGFGLLFAWKRLRNSGLPPNPVATHSHTLPF